MTESSSFPNPNEPVLDFSQCHAGIGKQLDMLSELPALLGPAARAQEIAVSALAFFRDVIFEHHVDEERELFPAVLESAQAGAEYQHVLDLVAQLTREHRELEATWKRVEANLKKVAKGQFAQVEVTDMERLVSQYREHARFEETEFLPLSQAILGRNSRHMAALGLSLHMRHAPKKPATFI